VWTGGIRFPMEAAEHFPQKRGVDWRSEERITGPAIVDLVRSDVSGVDWKEPVYERVWASKCGATEFQVWTGGVSQSLNAERQSFGCGLERPRRLLVDVVH
jgi:hypothetical protein